MQTIEAQLLFRPDAAALRFLPEGPYPYGEQRFSWVAIQHGADATRGSLNIFDLASRQNTRYDLSGRPGFAFPTADGQAFVIGLERQLGIFQLPSAGSSESDWTELAGPVDAEVTNTIINDGTLFEGGLIFGCKDLKFEEQKAGLYLWRARDRRLIRLRADQICSNGKKVVTFDGTSTLVDIDSPTKTVVAYSLDTDAGKLGEPRVIIDLRSVDMFPDGMVLTPDGASVIIAFYNPHEVEFGEARQYRLADSQLEFTWRVPGSPRVTCPQLIRHEGRVKLVLTTAVEHMTVEQQALHPHAGCLFIAETPFTDLPPAPRFTW